MAYLSGHDKCEILQTMITSYKQYFPVLVVDVLPESEQLSGPTARTEMKDRGGKLVKLPTAQTTAVLKGNSNCTTFVELLPQALASLPTHFDQVMIERSTLDERYCLELHAFDQEFTNEDDILYVVKTGQHPRHRQQPNPAPQVRNCRLKLTIRGDLSTLAGIVEEVQPFVQHETGVQFNLFSSKNEPVKFVRLNDQTVNPEDLQKALTYHFINHFKQDEQSDQKRRKMILLANRNKSSESFQVKQLFRDQSGVGESWFTHTQGKPVCRFQSSRHDVLCITVPSTDTEHQPRLFCVQPDGLQTRTLHTQENQKWSALPSVLHDVEPVTTTDFDHSDTQPPRHCRLRIKVSGTMDLLAQILDLCKQEHIVRRGYPIAVHFNQNHGSSDIASRFKVSSSARSQHVQHDSLEALQAYLVAKRLAARSVAWTAYPTDTTSDSVRASRRAASAWP